MTSAEYSAPVFPVVLGQENTKDPTINLAIGPSCPVRCEGCYNHFGNTAISGKIVAANEVLAFADAAIDQGIVQATISGGDPLFHPEIVPILSGLKQRELKVKLDTVGTLLLGEAPAIFKGKGTNGGVSVEDIAPHVDFVSTPLDGASQETIHHFRRGRANLFSETRIVASILNDAGVAFGYNTVAHKRNIHELRSIQDIVVEDRASEWQVFEYDPTGPNPSRYKNELGLEPGEFDLAVSNLEASETIEVSCKSLASRSGIYFLVDDAGNAWKPSGEGAKHSLGHITHDREMVLDALCEHIQQFRQHN